MTPAVVKFVLGFATDPILGNRDFGDFSHVAAGVRIVEQGIVQQQVEDLVATGGDDLTGDVLVEGRRVKLGALQQYLGDGRRQLRC